MIIQDAYVVMYNILDDYYCHESKSDSLASLLSDMDPNIFSDKKAADSATYNDWYNCISCYIKNGEITEENIILALKEFLIYYQQEFGYHLEDVINFISDKDFVKISASYTNTDNRKMKVIVKSQKSILNNDNIKWHLPDEKLWITKYEDYADIEKSIVNSVGSFNWLYEINDTVLFDKNAGTFKTAIIDLSGKICIGDLKEFVISVGGEQKGDIILAERKNCDFEFSSSVIYAECTDYLVAFPKDAGKQEYVILFIVDDFGFIIINDQLKGWILKNASKHICIEQGIGDDIDRTLLARYLNALKLWEEDDPTEIKSLLGIIGTRDDSFSVVIKNCLTRLL